MFDEDLLQRSYRRDSAVLAHVAAPPGAVARHVAPAIGRPGSVAARNLDRLATEGQLRVVTHGTPPVLSYLLAY